MVASTLTSPQERQDASDNKENDDNGTPENSPRPTQKSLASPGASSLGSENSSPNGHDDNTQFSNNDDDGESNKPQADSGNDYALFDKKGQLLEYQGSPDDTALKEYRVTVHVKYRQQIEADKKANKEQRLSRLKKLRKHYSNALLSNFMLQSIKMMHAELEKEAAQLRKELADTKAMVSKKKGTDKAMRLKECKDHADRAITITKTELWRITKFISTPDEEIEAAYKVFDFMQLDPKNWPPEKRDSWAVTYSPRITKALNSARNYLTSELKKVAWHLFKNKKPMPEAKVLLSCATRSCEDDDACIWYWDKIMPKVLGKDAWSDKVRYYQSISSLKTDDNKRLVTASTEAMAVIVWENNEKKWPELWEWCQKPENRGKKQPNWNGKWSITDGGHHDRCAWDPRGLEQFNTYKKQIRHARIGPDKDNPDREKEKKYLAWEAKVLGLVRKKMGYKHATHEDEQRAKKVSESILVHLHNDIVLTTFTSFVKGEEAQEGC